ncbi:hypothetical protein [Caudoviricetes sp.]|nr:hypothetical protein [Caudoviricetes sp.]
MAAENLKSAVITNATATPLVLSNSNIANGVLREGCGSITPAAAAEVASTYRFCRLPSNCRVSQILISCAAFTTAGAVDVGIYQTSENGGAVVDADLFASAVALTAAKDNSDVTHESAEYSLAEREKMLWEVLGLSADSNREYDVAMTVTTQFNGGSIMHLKARYVV